MCFLATVSSAGNLFLLPSKAPEDIYDIAFSVKMGNYCARRWKGKAVTELVSARRFCRPIDLFYHLIRNR